MRQRIEIRMIVELDGDEWLALEPSAEQEAERQRLLHYLRALSWGRKAAEVTAVEAEGIEPGTGTQACGCGYDGSEVQAVCRTGDALLMASLAADQKHLEHLDTYEYSWASGRAHEALDAHIYGRRS